MKECCKLCGKFAELRNSHVLPEFLYLPVYDDLHRAVKISSDIEENPQFIQKGFREPLLCQKCETQFSRYEGYAKGVVESITTALVDPKHLFKTVTNVDYHKFKLFQMSILWRACVAKNLAYNAVKLGEKHETNLRSMLISENPGYPYEFGCIMIIVEDANNLKRIIWSTDKIKMEGHNCYRFQTGDLFWYFVVSSHSKKHPMQGGFIAHDGLLRIFIAPWSEKEILGRIGVLLRNKEKKKITKHSSIN